MHPPTELLNRPESTGLFLHPDARRRIPLSGGPEHHTTWVELSTSISRWYRYHTVTALGDPTGSYRPRQRSSKDEPRWWLHEHVHVSASHPAHWSSLLASSLPAACGCAQREEPSSSSGPRRSTSQTAGCSWPEKPTWVRVYIYLSLIDILLKASLGPSAEARRPHPYLSVRAVVEAWGAGALGQRVVAGVGEVAAGLSLAGCWLSVWGTRREPSARRSPGLRAWHQYHSEYVSQWVSMYLCMSVSM